VKLVLLNLTGGGMSGGYKKYLQELIPRLSTHSSMEQLTIFSPNTMKKELNLLSNLDNRFFSTDDLANLKKNIISEMPDVVFIPTARWINFGEIPVVSMVRNMEPLVCPFAGNKLKERIRNIGRYFYCKQACKNAQRVIAVSKFVKNYIKNKWQINDNKLGLVYHGIGGSSEVDFEKPKSIPSHISKNFFFTAGSVRPARGLLDIIQAAHYLKEKNERVYFIIAGSVDHNNKKYKADLQKIILKCDLQDRIIWAGNLTRSQMNWCYANCRAFVMSSHVEACPNIALEAMKNDSFIISNKNKPMPEFFQNAALYYDSGASVDLAEIIIDFKSKTEFYLTKMKARRNLLVKQYQWDKACVQTVEQLQLAIDNK